MYDDLIATPIAISVVETPKVLNNLSAAYADASTSQYTCAAIGPAPTQQDIYEDIIEPQAHPVDEDVVKTAKPSRDDVDVSESGQGLLQMVSKLVGCLMLRPANF